MHWKKCVYWLIPFCIVSSVIADAVMDNKGITDPLAWGNISRDFATAMVAILIGLVMIVDYKNLLDWLDTHLGWTTSATCWFRVIGCCYLLVGLVMLASKITDALAALAIIPNPYLHW